MPSYGGVTCKASNLECCHKCDLATDRCVNLVTSLLLFSRQHQHRFCCIEYHSACITGIKPCFSHSRTLEPETLCFSLGFCKVFGKAGGNMDFFRMHGMLRVCVGNVFCKVCRNIDRHVCTGTKAFAALLTQTTTLFVLPKTKLTQVKYPPLLRACSTSAALTVTGLSTHSCTHTSDV